jgi:molybdenum cofactor cytidylyltransferase
MTIQHRRAAIILSAGYSGRLGRFKPLVKLGGQRVLERVIAAYRTAGATDIHVVTGFRSEDIRAALAPLPVTVVYNPDFDTGMFSSVLAGIDSLPADTDSFFIHPVDIPLVRPHSLARLMEAFDANSTEVIYPVFDGSRGHPPLLRGRLKSAIVAHEGNGGLRTLLDRFDDGAVQIPVADEGVLLDLDTPDDFERLSARLAAGPILNDRECRVLLETVCRLPQAVIAHCMVVAGVAEALASAVNAGGGRLDAALTRSAAYVHDAARLEGDHARAGARLLTAMGFPEMAAIIAVHMHIDAPADAPLDEAQLVYYADKRVSGASVVSIARRFDAKLKKYGGDPAVGANIQRQSRTALMIENKIESLTGQSVDRILMQAGLACGRRSCAAS